MACSVIKRFPAARAQSVGLRYLGGNGSYNTQLDQLRSSIPAAPKRANWEDDDMY
jgi:hypothetical protein